MPGGDQPMLDNMKSSMRRTALRYCITPEEAARPNPDFLAAQKESHCTYKKMAMDGGTINAEVVCEPEGQGRIQRSEEHTSELQSLMRISYAVFCLKKKTK